MNSDASFEQALTIGQANKAIIELAHNWCAHLSVEKYGGTGLIEFETGLPIGMRSFKCLHASAEGMAGMDLRYVALDFYDRNCVGCKERLPVRLPNLSELVSDRDRSRELAKRGESRAAELEANAVRSRAIRRSELSKYSAPAIAGIFDIVDRFDHDPNAQNREILIQTAVAAAAHFDSSVKEALFDLAEAGGSRTDAALEALKLAGAEPVRLCESALHSLARGEAYRAGTQIVATCLSKASEGSLPAALPALVSLAMPVEEFMSSNGLDGDPEALLTAYRLFPDLVLSAIRNLLRIQHKYPRIEACNAVSIINGVDQSFGLKVVDDLIDSLRLPDDLYGEHSSAESQVTRVLANIMEYHPHLVDDAIQRKIRVLAANAEAALFNVYNRVLRSDRSRSSQDAECTARVAGELAYGRLVDALTQRPSGQRLTEVIWFLRNRATSYPALLQRHAETLLGTAALMASELDAPQSPLMSLDIAPDPLKTLEQSSRRMALEQAFDALFQALGIAAAQNSNTTGALVLKTFEGLDDKHERLKSGLVRCLGAMAVDERLLPNTLPALYQAMTSQATRVRGAAAEAYASLAERDPEGLPSLVHDSFMLLLLDPFVFVHDRAVAALRKVSLPAQYIPQATSALFVLISAHLGTKSNSPVLSQAVEAMLELYAGDEQMPAKLRPILLSVIERMDVSAAAELITHRANMFRGTPGLTQILANLLGDEGLGEYLIEDLLRELAVARSDEIATAAESLRSAATTCALGNMEITDELVEILTAAGCWLPAVEIARDSSDRLSDTKWDRPRKLRSAIRQAAAEIEAAAAACDLKQISQLTARWLELDHEIEQNDEAHRKRRDPLFGLPLPNSGE